MIAGVDYDSFGVYVVALPHHESDVVFSWEVEFRKPNEARADRAFDTALRIPHMLPQLTRVDVAFIERGTGASRRSDFLLGRVQGLVAATLAMQGIAVNEMPAGEWKKALTGNGNAPKPAAHEALARLGFLLPENENSRDALAIAWTGRELNRAAVVDDDER